MNKTLFCSVGEPSGDQHTARMIAELAKIDPSIAVRGFGGPKMAAAGAALDMDLTGHAVVGLVEVLPKLRQFFSFVDDAEDIFRRGDVDSVLLVDFPGFNWHIAKRAKKYGLPVYYYCPPQLWAWAGWRIRKLRRNVDHVLSVLPIEAEYYTGKQVENTLVGHPFFDAVAEHKLDARTMASLKKSNDNGRRLVAVLPGSRGAEVAKNWPLMLEAIRQLSGRYGDIDFVVACHRDSLALRCRETLSDSDQGLPIQFYVGRTSEVIEAAECAMMVSGSVSLEMMARKTPAAVIYRVSRSMHMIASRLVHLDSITLPNLMAGRRIYPEMVSVGNPTPAIDFLCHSVASLLNDPFYRKRTLHEIEQLRIRFCRPGASVAAAGWIARAMDAATPRSILSGGSKDKSTGVGSTNSGPSKISSQTNQSRAA